MSYIDIFNIDPIQDLFAGIVPNSVMVADNESTIQGLLMKSGEILIGDTGKIPTVATMQGTLNQVTINYVMESGSRMIKFSLPQDIHTTAMPTFSGLRLPHFDLVYDHISGLYLQDTKDLSQPINIRPSDHKDGPAIILENKVILNNLGKGIEFAGHDGNQILRANIVDSDQLWVLPKLGLSQVFFAGLGGTQTFTGIKTFNEETHFTKTLLPVTSGIVDIGSDSKRFRRVLCGTGDGTVGLGMGIRSTGRAELHLHSEGDNSTDLVFGVGSREDKNMKWDISSRGGSDNDCLRLYRMPKLTGSGFQEVINVHGSGGKAGSTVYELNIPATSTTSGAVQIKGGLGVVGSIYCGALNVNGTSLDLSNYVTLSTAQTITGQKKFTGYLQSDMLMPGRIMIPNFEGKINTMYASYGDSATSVVFGYDAGYRPGQGLPYDGTYMDRGNILFGSHTGVTTEGTSSYNSYFGYRAGNGIGNNYNTSMGYRALDSGELAKGPTCNRNTVIGALAMNRPNSNNEWKVGYNTVVGFEAAKNFWIASNNTMIGAGTGSTTITSSNCTHIGYNARSAGDDHSTIAIGSGAIAPGNGHCRIGDNNIVALTLGSTSATIGHFDWPISQVIAKQLQITGGGSITLNSTNLHNDGEVKGNWIYTNVNFDNSQWSTKYTKVMNHVSITFWAKNFNITAGVAPMLMTDGSIPSGLRPNTKVSTFVYIKQNNTFRIGLFTIEGGNIQMYAVPPTTSFTGACGYDAFTVNYTL